MMEMVINCEKTGVYAYGRSEQTIINISRHFNILVKELDTGLKYLGFILKPNNYRIANWKWLVNKIERRTTHRCNRWISRGRLVLIKAIVEAIPLY